MVPHQAENTISQKVVQVKMLIQQLILKQNHINTLHVAIARNKRTGPKKTAPFFISVVISAAGAGNICFEELGEEYHTLSDKSRKTCLMAKTRAIGNGEFS